MSRGYRGILAAFAGLTALCIAAGTGAYFGALYGPDQKHYQAVAGEQPGQNDYAGPSQSLPNISGLPGLVERAIANPHPPGGQDHEKRDLAAQEASALWAFWMVAASFGSVLITALGTVFLYKQIVLTRRAVEDTGEATKAMREANAIARDIGQAQTRAYLSIKSLEGKKVDGGLVFRATVQNSGQSPALSAQIMLQVVDKDGEKIEVLPEHEHHIPAQSAPILAYCYFKSEQATTWPGIVIIATVAYSDVFLSLDKIQETFAGIPMDWSNDEFAELTQGMHVASYIRSMEGG